MFAAEEPRVAKSNSGTHANSVIMSSRRCTSSKPSPARCDLRKSWKTGPPSTKEKSVGSSRKFGSITAGKLLPSAGSCCVDAMRPFSAATNKHGSKDESVAALSLLVFRRDRGPGLIRIEAHHPLGLGFAVSLCVACFSRPTLRLLNHKSRHAG